MKIREPGRSAFSLISFKYQPNIDHPVSVAQELVAENHVHGHDYILVAANIDKILTTKGKIRFTLYKIEGKGETTSLCFFFVRCKNFLVEKEAASYAEISLEETPLTTTTTTGKSISSSGLRSANSIRHENSTHQTTATTALKTDEILTPSTIS